MALPRILINSLRAASLLTPLLRTRPAKGMLKSMLKLFPRGPAEERRKKAIATMVGEVTDNAGGRAVSRLQMPEGYTLTAMTTVEIMKRILAGEFVAGFQTPSRAYGPDFILGFEGTSRVDL